MAGKVLCAAAKLYNILNQYTHLSRLSDSNYLCLIDARAVESYCSDHIITAKNARWDSEGKFVMPRDVEIESMRYIIVYDSNTCSMLESGPAKNCADALEKASNFPVQILTGGYEQFTALYPFLRTQKIIYTIRELEILNPYPVVILPSQLYMGDFKQATDPQIRKDLKLNALVNVSDESSSRFGNCNVLKITIADSVQADLFTSLEEICVFIDSHLSSASPVMVFSSLGRSRCCAVAIAFLMHHLKHTLEESWKHIKQCSVNLRPNRGFVQQLSDWELHTFGERVTNIAEPNY